MPYARQAAAADFTFPVRQPHSHNLPLGVPATPACWAWRRRLVVVVTLSWWPARGGAARRSDERRGIVLIGLGIGGLFDDLTFIPGFDLLAIRWWRSRCSMPAP